MKKRFSILATALLGLPALLLSGCQKADSIANGNSPYFGVSDTNKRWVPQELQEDEEEEYHDYEESD